MSLGGKTSEWGREEAETRVAAKNPDLVIVAFGMGDGHVTKKTSNAVYKANLQGIIDTVRKRNADCEFIVVGTMLANPESPSFSGNQRYFLVPLGELVQENKGVALAGVTSAQCLHADAKEVLGHERQRREPPVRLPLLARVYAQVLLKLLVADGTR